MQVTCEEKEWSVKNLLIDKNGLEKIKNRFMAQMTL